MAMPLSPAQNCGVLTAVSGAPATATKRPAATKRPGASSIAVDAIELSPSRLRAAAQPSASASAPSSSASASSSSASASASFFPLSSSASIWRWAPQAGERLTRRTAPRFLAMVLLGAAAVAAGRWLVFSGGGDRLTAGLLHGEALARALRWAKANPARGAAAFAALEAVAVAALVPASLFCAAGGALFGPYLGAAAGFAGLAAGQGAAFALGRTLLRSRVAAWLAAAPPRWATVDTALAKGGWRLVVLLRLSPVVPWNLLNYALAISGIGWRAYFVASAAAVAPWAALFAHLGSLAASLADLFEDSSSSGAKGGGKTKHDGPFGEHTLLVTAAGAALAVAAASYVVFLARRELRQALRAEGGAVGAAALDELAPLEAEVEDDNGDDSEGGSERSGGGDEEDKEKDVEKGQQH